MEGREQGILTCFSCGLETEHTLTYAGRLLVSSVCGNCGFTWHHDEDDLRSAYLRDLESRIWNKPGRWLRRLRRHPLQTAREFPGALARLPVKLAREIVTVFRD